LPGAYFDLEQESERTRLDVRWDSVCHGREMVILDEAQAWPEIFPRLRAAIDSDRRRNGRFLLLGSVSPSLMTRVSESLAGRLSLVELSPLLTAELPSVPLANLWLRGGFPDGVLDSGRFPQWQRDYLTLLVQRDLPHWGLSAKPQATQRLLGMLSAVHGQLWNASQLGQSLGLSHPTVNSHLDYLEGAFLIRRLQPYRANLKKRLVRTPKCYWRDSGLLHAMLRVADMDDLLRQPWVGASWEGFVIEQIVGTLQTLGQSPEPFFFRTSDQYEIDLVLAVGKELWAVEIKLTSAPSPDDLRRLNKTADLIKADKRILISQTTTDVADGRQMSCALPSLLRLLQERLPKARS
ncbi:MAG: DUF4143 domain-containing protein, partial [Verrucomicrobia bacterium]|nr:DUF4143 domain-containing protein [Verrucomicrobiota bacterium]